MITVGMNYNVLQGKEVQFEKVFANVLQSLATTEGHENSALYKDVHDVQSYLIVSEWSSEDAFRSFIQSDQFKKVTDWGAEQILSGRPVHTVYRQ